MLLWHGRSLSVFEPISAVICPWHNFTVSAIFAITCPNEWISMKLCSCNVVRAWTLSFGLDLMDSAFFEITSVLMNRFQ